MTWNVTEPMPRSYGIHYNNLLVKVSENLHHKLMMIKRFFLILSVHIPRLDTVLELALSINTLTVSVQDLACSQLAHDSHKVVSVQ